MTYPPQQPNGPQQPGGQQPWGGQQPGGYPSQPTPPGGYPQQPMQPGGYPQQAPPPGAGYQAGGHQPSPQQPNGPQQPAGQQPWGGQQPGGYPAQQPGGYGQFPQPPAGPGQPQPGDAPGRRKSPLPWILTGAGALVVVIAVVLVFVLHGGGDPKSVAQSFAAAFNNRDTNALKATLCAKDADSAAEAMQLSDLSAIPDVPDEVKNQLKKVTVKMAITDVTQTDDNNAKATVSLSLENVPPQLQGRAQEMTKAVGNEPLPLVKEGGAWKVCVSA